MVVGGRDTRGMSPRAIDEYVRARLAAGGGPVHPARGRAGRAGAGPHPHPGPVPGLRAAGRPRRAALDHSGCRADVLSLDPHTLEDVLDSILAVGAADRRRARPGRAPGRRAARPAGHSGRRRRPAGRGRGSRWSSGSTRRSPPATGCPTWSRAAGGDPVAARPGGRSVQTTWAGFAAARPDVVAGRAVRLPPRRGRGAGPRGRRRAARRCRSGPIDADGLVVRPGPRLVDGVEAIAAILHPGRGAGQRRGDPRRLTAGPAGAGISGRRAAGWGCRGRG